MRGLYGPRIALYEVVDFHGWLAGSVRLFEVHHRGIAVPQGDGGIGSHQIVKRLLLRLDPNYGRGRWILLRLELLGLLNRLELVLPELCKLVRNRSRIVAGLILWIIWIRHSTSSFLPEIQNNFVAGIPGVVKHIVNHAHHMAG